MDTHIICACETWALHNNITLPAHLGNYTPIWVNAIKDKTRGRGSGGLAILTDNALGTSEVLDTSERWIFARFSCAGLDYIVGTVYFRPKLELTPLLESLQLTLEHLTSKYPEAILIIGGDFNTRIGELGEVYPDLLDDSILLPTRRALDTKISQDGTRLADFMAANGLLCLNGRTPSDNPACFTFSAEVGNSIIDLVWVNMRCLPLIADLRVNTIMTGSDHFPVILELVYPFPATADVPHDAQPKTANPSGMAASWSAEKCARFESGMLGSQRLRLDFNLASVDEQYGNLTAAIMEEGQKAGILKPKSLPRGPRRRHKPWYDEECVSAKNAANTALMEYRSSGFAEDLKLPSRMAASTYKNIVKAKRQAHDLVIINALANVRNSREFWEAVKKCRPRNYTPPCISLSRWVNFYRNVYPPRILVNSDFLETRHPFLDAPITHAELKSNLKKLKNAKAPGIDNIGNEFYKNLPPNWILYLEVMFNKILVSKKTPAAWSCAALTMLHKKGDKQDPANYRGIALISCVTKLFTQILKCRIQAWAEGNDILPECQAGFRAGRSCLDQIFTLQCAVQMQLRLKGRKVYGLFVDFKRAFDSVPHGKLWHKLSNLGLSTNLVLLLKNLYDGASACVRVEGELSDSFGVTEGVLQGETLSPLLFILYLADIEQFLRTRGLEGVNVDGVNDIMLLMYADDLIVLSHSRVDLRRKLCALQEFCQSTGLEVNTSKTKVVVFRAGGALSQEDVHGFEFDGVKLQVVSNYTYLGVTFSSSCLGLRAAKEAVAKTKIANGTLLSTLTLAKCNSWAARLKLFNAVARATLLYASPAWGLRYGDVHEPAQTDFFKRLLLLPQCTANCALRLELGLVKIEFYMWKQTLDFITRIL